MTSKTYNMSFTLGSLLLGECINIVKLYLEHQDWTKVREVAVADNTLQARTLNTSKRLVREVISRLRKLSHQELQLLIASDRQQQCYLLWLAICRRYNFIADFASQVLHEHYVSMKPKLTHIDYDIFFNQKAEWHPELEKLTDATRYKLRQNLFRMMTDAGLLDKSNTIIAAFPSREVATAIAAFDKGNLTYLPLIESRLLGIAT